MSDALRLPIQDSYDIDGRRIAVGRVESGVLRAGRPLWVMPEGLRLSETWGIRKFLEPDVTEAPEGDCVGIEAPEQALRRGQVLVDQGPVVCRDRLRASVLWLSDRPGRLGDRATWKGTTQEVTARIARIAKRFDPAELALVEADAGEILASEVAEVELELDGPVVADSFGDIAAMGRFTLEHQGEPIAGGIVLASA